MSEYQVGDYLMHEGSGVCQVAEISEKALQGKGSEKMYYSLEPVFQKGAQVLTPVSSKLRIRDVKSQEEMQNLLDRVLELPVIPEQNIRTLGDIFKEKISEFDPVPLATVVKTVYLREQMRMASGKKAMSSDEKVMATAGRKLFEEMANLRLKRTGSGLDIVLERITSHYPKDKYSAFSYGLWRIKELEEEYCKRKKKKSSRSRQLVFFTGGN